MISFGGEYKWIKVLLGCTKYNRNRRREYHPHEYDLVKGPIADDGVALQLGRLRAHADSAEAIAIDLQDVYLDQQICFATIKSADNPYYDKTVASELGLGLLMLPWAIDESFLDYLVENNLLPDASCNSIYGEEHGHELIQSNIYFLKDYFRGIS